MTRDSSTVNNSSNTLSKEDTERLKELGFKATGVNSEDPKSGVWFGEDGPYSNEFSNESGEDIILVIWGPHASWVNVHQPLITTSIADGSSTIVSFADKQTGAFSAIYHDTKMLNGQISNTWGEYTCSKDGVWNVSRLPNMNGKSVSIEGPKCVTDMETCVFVCPDSDICMYDYQLKNCENGSQPGAQYGLDYGAPSGGCGGLGDGARVKTVFS